MGDQLTVHRMSPSSLSAQQGHASTPAALVIEPVLPNLLAVLSALASLGFDTTVAETYQDAKASLYAHRPTLLVTGLKLREYNGLQLVLRGTTVWPELRSIVTSDGVDPVLQGETERLGATFLVMPTSQQELEAAISRTVLQTRSPAHPIRAPFERRRPPAASEIEATFGPAERRRNVAEVLRNLA